MYILQSNKKEVTIMKHVGIAKARKYFTKLVARVRETGEGGVITDRGSPAGMINPCDDARADRVRQAIREMKKIRSTLPVVNDENLKLAKEGGRR